MREFKVRKCEGVRGEISSENQTEIDFRFERKCTDDRGELRPFVLTSLEIFAPLRSRNAFSATKQR